MSDEEIQFGDVEEIRPRSAVRPDCDAHFAVCEVGTVAEGTLPIFVDLDALRDMEAHGQTNKDVELGGVMLGGQYEDSDGKAFVLVTDSLRAEHYEATKGSFKFTHETWTAISRQRDEFAPDMEMVGWYHTHPDWGVFLSGMDLFICENFFKRPLDVALVIDPCRHDRGWFYWTSVAHQTIKPTGGFYLYASRFRKDELEYFAELYHGHSNPRKSDSRTSDQKYLFQGIPSMVDPRYSGIGSPSSSPVVNLVDQRQPPNTAIWAVMAAQFLLILYLAFQLFVVDTKQEEEKKLADNIEEISQSVAKLNSDNQAVIENTAYKQLLGYVMTQKPDASDMMQKLKETQTENIGLHSDNAALRVHNQGLTADLKDTHRKLTNSTNLIKSKQESIDALKEKASSLEKKLKETDKKTTNWPLIFWLIGGGVFLLVGGVTAGYLYARQQFMDDYYEREPAPSRASLAELPTRDEIEKSENEGSDSINFKD
jgi:proteasome lid subunit RPN8/RPN11